MKLSGKVDPTLYYGEYNLAYPTRAKSSASYPEKLRTTKQIGEPPPCLSKGRS